MQGLKDALPVIPRITYREDQEGLELTDEEKQLDDKRVDEELEVLGSIGFKNAKEPYLVGPDKIPAYLSVFLEKMKRQAEEFKINQVRQLRVSAGRFKELCS